MSGTAVKATVLAALVAAGTASAVQPAVAGKKRQGKTSSGRIARTVEVGSDYFDPARITVRAGDRVRWRWNPGFALHDIYVDRGPYEFNSPTQQAGQFTHTFKKPGTFKLYCTQHEMQMTVTVRKRQGR